MTSFAADLAPRTERRHPAAHTPDPPPPLTPPPTTPHTPPPPPPPPPPPTPPPVRGTPPPRRHVHSLPRHPPPPALAQPAYHLRVRRPRRPTGGSAAYTTPVTRHSAPRRVRPPTPPPLRNRGRNLNPNHEARSPLPYCRAPASAPRRSCAPPPPSDPPSSSTAGYLSRLSQRRRRFNFPFPSSRRQLAGLPAPATCCARNRGLPRPRTHHPHQSAAACPPRLGPPAAGLLPHPRPTLPRSHTRASLRDLASEYATWPRDPYLPPRIRPPPLVDLTHSGPP